MSERASIDTLGRRVLNALLTYAEQNRTEDVPSICQKDFVPASVGIFDGPIPIHGAALMGIDLRQINLTTGLIIEVPE